MLRPRQKVFVDKCISKLNKEGNTLGVATVGFGKTFCMSAVADIMIKNHNIKKTLVLQHRTELKEQNNNKFNLVTKEKYKTSYVQGAKKDFSGDIVFGMIQTVARNLDTIPKFDLVIIDEAHRALGNQYIETIKELKELNKEIKILGVTATPNRGDGQGLKKVFNNVADVVTIEETIEAGNLVPPRTYSLDIGQLAKLQEVQTTSNGEYDQDEVADILDTIEITNGVFKYWDEIARGRKTIAFCASVKHAKNLQSYFNKRGVKTALVHGGLNKKDRKEQIKYYEYGEAEIIFNVAVFTEGYDYPPTSCVILLRQSSYHGTMVQMIGRGLRIVNENEYPKYKNKVDCIVLDFGVSTSLHGSLEAGVQLNNTRVKIEEEEEFDEKICAECFSIIPSKEKECPICGFKEEKKLRIIKEKEKLPVDFSLVEVNLLSKSSYRYENFYKGNVWCAGGFEANSFIIKYKDNWNLFVKKDGYGLSKILTSTRQKCIQESNSWLNKNNIDPKGKKNKEWQKRKPTLKQEEILERLLKGKYKKGMIKERYVAKQLISFLFIKDDIKRNLL